MRFSFVLCLGLICLGGLALDSARINAQEGFGQRPPEFQSLEVSADRQVTFRAYAPKAESVRVSSSDMPNVGAGLSMKKSEKGIWEATSDKLPGGAYRYRFDIDGVAVIDPRNSVTSESNSNTWSLVTVPGSDYSDLRDVPHGAVAKIDYYSKSLSKFRRLHVYTPPGYEKGTASYPVLYLLHGAFDCDASWSTVGQAGQIMDNLIADGKAKPMIVVMPMGHTGAFSFGPGNSFEKQMSEFESDFQQDIRSTIAARYRTIEDNRHRAIAGLSMGGAQTLNIAFADLADYAYIGVFSSGVFGIERGGIESDAGKAWLAKSKSIGNADLKRNVGLVWLATGKEDFLLETSRATVKALKDKGFDVTYNETEGGHTWLNWRDYLRDFSPKLFQD